MDFLMMVLLTIVLDIVTFRGIKRIFPEFGFRKRRTVRIVFTIQALLVLGILLGGLLLKNHVRDYRLTALYYYLFGGVMALYFPKLLFVAVLIVDWLLLAINRRKRHSRRLPPRRSRHVFAKCGIAVCLFFAVLLIWGMLFGNRNYTVEPVEITLDALPPAFDGYRIVQISDIHAGSFFGKTGCFREAVDIINRLHPDVIVFTGDMVNNFAEETDPLIPVFSQLNAKDGKYAVLGNHDYGKYYEWADVEDQADNRKALETAIARMGFELLNNSAVPLEKDSSNRIALVGVENWGAAKRHPKEADIGKAAEAVNDIPFKILLSHDPSYWCEKIVGKTDPALTLSGHTHGGQIGFKLGKNRLGPIKLRYRYWAGLYHSGNQYLYINRGLGVIGYPGRIGMPPEITLITLKKGSDSGF